MIERPQPPCAHHERQADEGNDEDEKYDESPRERRLYRWQWRQKTELRPAMRTSDSGRPQVKQGSPARP